MKYRGYLFDLDGTILDTTDLIVDSFRYSLNWAASIEVDRKEIVSLIGMPLKDQLKLQLGHIKKDWDYDQIAEKHMEHQMTHWKEKVCVFDGMEDILSTLKENGAKIAIVTSRKKQTTNLYTKELGISKYFDVFITPEETQYHKPHREPALVAMERLNVTAEQSIFIGDSRFDMECAQSAKVDFAFVSWGTGHTQELKMKMTNISHTPEELKKFLLNIE